jgi:hypothetical protein
VVSASLLTGWTPGLDVAAALRRTHPEASGGQLVLVTLVDSSPNVGELPSVAAALTELRDFYAEIERDVVVKIGTFFTLADEYALFTGFDEVWLVDRIPDSGKPDRFRLTSDVSFGPTPPEGLEEWMRGAGCTAGLGDGDGLNFVTFDPELAALWR